MRYLLFFISFLFSSFIFRGQITFSEEISTPFQSFDGAFKIASEDVDQDNDQDILVVGFDEITYERLTKLYINDGNGGFSEATNQPFSISFDNQIRFIDIDSDNDKDLITSSGLAYINNNGTYSAYYSGIEGVSRSSFTFSDVDKDGDIDVFVCGRNFSKLSLNNGDGTFSVSTASFFEFETSSIPSTMFGDIDGDNDDDLIIMGPHYDEESTLDQRLVKLYENDGTGIFSEVQNPPFIGLAYGNIRFADIDNDNDQDLILFGKNETSSDDHQYKIRFYFNDGAGNYSESPNDPILIANAPVNANGQIMLSDLDLDNDLDIVATAFTTKIYENDSSGNFSKVENTSLKGFRNGSIVFDDFNSDNYNDILLVGYNSSTYYGASLYFNNTYETLGSNDFEENLTEYFHPNPIEKNQKITINKPVKEIIIYDLYGRKTFNTYDNEFKIDKLTPGTYIMKILLNNNKNILKKIIIIN